MSNESNLSERILNWMEPITIYPYRTRFQFENPEEFQVSTLRGIWGRALHELDVRVYSEIFRGAGSKQSATPRYILRVSERQGEIELGEIALDFVVWGVSDAELDVMARAWNLAGRFGLGKNRLPFRLKRIDFLYAPIPQSGLSLARLVKASIQESERARVRAIEFPLPLRFLERQAHVMEPTFEEFVKRTLARLSTIRLQTTGAFAQVADSGRPADFRPEFYAEVMELANNFPTSPWRGSRCDFQRYSGSQRADLEMRGVVGGWNLYADLGALKPLVVAAEILHVGKTTTLGLGRPRLRSTSLS